MRSSKLHPFFAGSIVVLSIALVATACSSKTPTGSKTTPTTVPSLSATSFTADFSVMAQLTGLASQGHGKIGVLLPETTTSARYTDFDAPLLKKAMEAVGLKQGTDFIITNAQGSEDTEYSQAQTDITQGATVLIMDPFSSGVGARIESYAKSHNVKVIDYDRLTLGGSRDYYVSFDNVAVGKTIGQGFVDCVTAWKLANPEVLVMRGAATDNNATLFAQGYNEVLQPHFASGEYKLVGRTAGSWDGPTSANYFQQQYTAHKNINAVVMPNDTTAAAVIALIKNYSIPAKKFPVTGQDAQTSGLQNILAGYQCGSVYKPYWKETQAAVALALYLRAGQTPPPGLVNGTAKDGTADVQSVLLDAVWVTTDKIASVIADGVVKRADVCTSAFASLCTAAGI
jgi:D-xylose transport system substrate-binding protein